LRGLVYTQNSTNSTKTIILGGKMNEIRYFSMFTGVGGKF